MIIGIDASNLLVGGGVTYLIELLRKTDPGQHGFNQIVVWGNKSTCAQLPSFPWIKVVSEPMLEKSLPYRIYWQQFRLSKLAVQQNCNVLLFPGGRYYGKFRPYVAMFQSMLPFHFREMCRYYFTPRFFKLLFLRYIQLNTFRRANGIILLNDDKSIPRFQYLKSLNIPIAIIPHAASEVFLREPRPQRTIESYSEKHPFRILYVSVVEAYKHQWQVVKAVNQLRQQGLPVALDLVGAGYKPALRKLMKVIRQYDPDGKFINYYGKASFDRLLHYYATDNLFVFASTCECLPIILLEAMASGLPIACSNRSVMPGLLKDAAVYFDPENTQDIVHAIQCLIESADLRTEISQKSFDRAKAYSWGLCAKETFSFLTNVASEA